MKDAQRRQTVAYWSATLTMASCNFVIGLICVVLLIHALAIANMLAAGLFATASVLSFGLAHYQFKRAQRLYDQLMAIKDKKWPEDYWDPKEGDK